MNGNPFQTNSGTKFMVVFTDLDGCLLDKNTYEWKEAEPTLDLLRNYRIPVVLVSSKTRPEMELLRKKMSISDPFITENGGGIFFSSTAFLERPKNASPVADPEGLWQITLGVPYEKLINALREIRHELALNLKGFSDMTHDEIGRLTGLDTETSGLAARREYDEPFIIEDEKPSDRAAIIKAAEKRGLTIAIGGRFYHLQGGNNKGESMDVITSLYHKTYGNCISIALGDSPTDFSMLARADYPVLIRSEQDFPMFKEKIPGLRYTQKMGPSGWNEAVMELLKTEFMD